MPKLIVTDRAGIEHEINADPGLSVMEILRDNGMDELLALCGGCCSCAACHVYVGEEYMGALPPMIEDEDDFSTAPAVAMRVPDYHASYHFTPDWMVCGLR